MNIKFNYLENALDFSNGIFSLEIENKNYFYRCVRDLNLISNGDVLDCVYCFDNNNEEIIISNKVMIISDYFNFDNLFKSYSSSLIKYISNLCDDEINNKMALIYKKLKKDFSRFITQIDLPIIINDEFSLDLFIKLLKPRFLISDSLLNNLFLCVDLEKIFKLNKILVFINLKQYLNHSELIELYKYALYNEIKILLIDSQSYGPTLEYEKKLIIDENLDEIML